MGDLARSSPHLRKSVGDDGTQRGHHYRAVASFDHDPGETRYAHLSPSHLKAAVQGVAGFGKAPAAGRENQVPAGAPKPVQNGTLTETGMPVSVGLESGIEVRKIYGAGDLD